MEDDLIAIFELTVQDEQVRLVSEKHYRLVPSTEISSEDLGFYRNSSGKAFNKALLSDNFSAALQICR